MTFQEHNNRKKADRFAEYITGETLNINGGMYML